MFLSYATQKVLTFNLHTFFSFDVLSQVYYDGYSVRIFTDLSFSIALQRYPWYYTLSRWFCYGFLGTRSSFLAGDLCLPGRKYL